MTTKTTVILALLFLFVGCESKETSKKHHYGRFYRGWGTLYRGE